METTYSPGLKRHIPRVGLGTWALGGWMWGGTKKNEPIDTILTAIDKGVTLIDTAPVYGFGKSEELVGKALKEHGDRESITLVTKWGLEWDEDENVVRNSSMERLEKELDDSLKRLDTDYIDVYLVHWPDTAVPFEETAEGMNKFLQRGKVRSIGVSNYSPAQMDEFRKIAPIHFAQPPYNLFEREIEHDVMPYCKKHDITMLGYGALCRGMLSGNMSPEQTFEGDDLRNMDPRFQDPQFKEYLEAVRKLEEFAMRNNARHVIHLAVRWILDKGMDVALWGARKPEQLAPLDRTFGWKLDQTALKEIDDILNETIEEPVGASFMSPPTRGESEVTRE